MNLDRTVEIAGLPIKTVRDAIREMDRHDNNDHGWAVEELGDHLKISATHAEWLCEGLREQGILERAPQPDTRWHSRGLYYRVSRRGTRFTNASMLKRIDRAHVDRLLAGLLERVEAINANNELCCFVNEIRLFGSAADPKAKSFADVDICYVLARRKRPTQYKQWADWNIARAEQSGRRGLQYFEMLFYGETEVKRMLKNRSSYLSLHDLDDVVSIGADSIRLYVTPEGAIEADDGRMSGKALSQAGIKDATKNAAMRGKRRQDKKTSMPTATKDEPPRDRMVRAVKSLAFDILRAIDEPEALEALEQHRSCTQEHSSISPRRRDRACSGYST